MVHQIAEEFVNDLNKANHSRNSTLDKPCVMCEGLTLDDEVLPCGHFMCNGCKKRFLKCPDCGEMILSELEEKVLDCGRYSLDLILRSQSHDASEKFSKNSHAIPLPLRDRPSFRPGLSMLIEVRDRPPPDRASVSQKAVETKAKDETPAQTDKMNESSSVSSLDHKTSDPAHDIMALFEGDSQAPQKEEEEEEGGFGGVHDLMDAQSLLQKILQLETQVTQLSHEKETAVKEAELSRKRNDKISKISTPQRKGTKKGSRKTPEPERAKKSGWKPYIPNPKRSSTATRKGKKKKGNPQEKSPRAPTPPPEALKSWKPAKYDLQEKKTLVSSQSSISVRKEGPRDIGRNKGWKPAKFETCRSRSKSAGVQQKTVEQKLGPREIGRIKDWKPAQYDVKSDGDFLKERFSSIPTRARAKTNPEDGRGKFQVYKEGPRDIGRIRDWKPAKYEIDQGGDFLAERLSNNKRMKTMMEQKHDAKIYKAGPREIGRIKDWKPADYNLKKDNASFLKERLNSDRRAKSVTNFRVRKAGPREIGRNSDWQSANYDLSDGSADFLKERVGGSRKNLMASADPTLKKAGPREIGRIKDWKPATYDIKEDSGDFLQERNRSGSRGIQRPAKKKEGPREIGRIRDWKPASYDIRAGSQSDSFLAERLTTNSSYSLNTRQGPALQGPRDIGRIRKNSGWKPAKYDIKSDESSFLKERVQTASSTANQVSQKKGPRDVKKIKDWKPAKYPEKSESDLLSKKKPKRTTPRKSPRHTKVLSDTTTTKENPALKHLKGKSMSMSSFPSGRPPKAENFIPKIVQESSGEPVRPKWKNIKFDQAPFQQKIDGGGSPKRKQSAAKNPSMVSVKKVTPNEGVSPRKNSWSKLQIRNGFLSSDDRDRQGGRIQRWVSQDWAIVVNNNDFTDEHRESGVFRKISLYE